MKKYEYTLKDSQEAIYQTTASSKKEAIEIFARIKNLSVRDFLEIYHVRLSK